MMNKEERLEYSKKALEEVYAMKGKRVLITGGAGFVGAHLVEHILKSTDWNVVIIDRLNNASSGFNRLRDIPAWGSPRINVLATDLSMEIPEGVAQEIGEVDYIFHLAAESHVQKSIEEPYRFLKSNVEGTFWMLEFARKQKNLEKFFYFSTDEVFGNAPLGVEYKEDDRLNPRNPYACFKASGELMMKAWGNTYGIPYIITNSMNIFGERQHPEKFVPLCIKKILENEKIGIHIDPKTKKPGSRFWVHARNTSALLLFLIAKGEIGQRYNIVPDTELDNLEIPQLIAKIMNKPLKYKLVDYHSTRPGHDPRYALDGTKVKEMGWEFPVGFEDSFRKTIEWSLKKENFKWTNI